MKRIERRATIGAPPDEVFAFLADIERIGEWQADIVRVKRTSPGPVARGATADVAREVMGQRVEVPLTVTDYERPRRLGIETSISGVQARAQLDLAPSGGGSATELDFALEIRGSMLSAFLEPMIADAAASEVDASLESIRAHFEG